MRFEHSFKILGLNPLMSQLVFGSKFAIILRMTAGLVLLKENWLFTCGKGKSECCLLVEGSSLTILSATVEKKSLKWLAID